jgi:hypothetical protein
MNSSFPDISCFLRRYGHGQYGLVNGINIRKKNGCEYALSGNCGLRLGEIAVTSLHEGQAFSPWPGKKERAWEEGADARTCGVRRDQEARGMIEGHVLKIPHYLSVSLFRRAFRLRTITSGVQSDWHHIGW